MMALRRCPAPGVFDNDNGHLHCGGLQHAEGIPPGGYRDSCQGCALAGSSLTCMHCRAADGRQLEASYDVQKCVAPGKIDNDNGALICSGMVNQRGIPAGAYQGSCEGCRLERGGALLTCAQCRDASGRRHETSYEPKRCPPPGKLDNANGMLRCTGLPNGDNIPAGGYRDSCQGCTFDGSVLSCSHCSTSDGRQLASSYDLSPCRRKRRGACCVSFDNADGVLRCAADGLR